MVGRQLSKNPSHALVLVVYLLLAVLLLKWIGRRCELVYFPQHRHAVLFCAGVDALRVWPPFEQPWVEPEQDQRPTIQAYLPITE